MTQADRRDAQSVEIALAVMVGVIVFLGLVVPGAWLADLLDLHGAVWAVTGRVALMGAAVVAIGSVIAVVLSARRRGL